MHARVRAGRVLLNLMPGRDAPTAWRSAANAYALRSSCWNRAHHKPIPDGYVRAIHQRIPVKAAAVLGADERTPLPVVVVTFWRCWSCTSAMVKIEQQEQFGDIDIHYIEGSGELGGRRRPDVVEIPMFQGLRKPVAGRPQNGSCS